MQLVQLERHIINTKIVKSLIDQRDSERVLEMLEPRQKIGHIDENQLLKE